MAATQPTNWRFPESATIRAAILELLTTYAEGLIVPSGKESHNAFHRPLQWTSRPELSYLMGLSYQGIRTVGWVSARELIDQAATVEDMATAQLPVVIVAEGSLQGWDTLATTGAIVWTPGTGQEAIDRVIMAQHLAEQVLTPVIVWLEPALLEQSAVKVPAKEAVLSFLGRAEQFIPSPTPAQQLIFGEQRARVPHTFSSDTPVLQGAGMNHQDAAVQLQSKENFWRKDLTALIEATQTAWTRLTQRPWAAFHFEPHHKEHVLIAMGATHSTIVESLTAASRKEKASYLHLSQLAPFPVDALRQVPGKAIGITTLEPLSLHHPLATRCQAAMEKPLQWIRAQYGPLPDTIALQQVLRNAAAGNTAVPQFTLAVTATRPGRSPKQQLRQQELERLFPDSMHDLFSPSGQERSPSLPLPEAVRQYQNKGPRYSHLSSFFDHTALLYEQGLPTDTDYVAPRLPAESALLNDTIQETGYPTFLPERCTACGACQFYCPHAAIPAAMLEWEPLLADTIKQLTKQGTPITMLMPVLKAWQQQCDLVLQRAEHRPTRLEPLLEQSFSALAEQMGWKDEPLTQARQEKEVILRAVGQVPIAATDTHYFQRERQSAGSGTVFTLAIDPNACTQCGICVAVCPEDALQIHDRRQQTYTEVQQAWSAFHLLPDTSGDTLRRLVEDEEHHSLSALALSRHFYHSLSGGQPADDGSAQKVMLHQVTTVAESLYQQHQQQALTQLKQLQKDLDAQIQKQLAKALPAEQYEALLAALHRQRSSQVPFDTIINEWGHQEHLRLIDTKVLKRRVALAKDLQALQQVLTEGPTGMGRSRFGVALDAGQWGSTFPWNPWSVPVVVHGRRGQASLVRGLWQGQVRHVLDNLRLVRRAELEAKNKYDRYQHDTGIANLSWSDLSNEERQWAPPILWVIDRAQYAKEDQQAIAQLWEEDVPVKLILLDDVAPAYDQGLAYTHETMRQLMQSLSTPNLRLIKTTLALPEHLFKGLQLALHSPDPAVVWLMAPDYHKHNVSYQNWPRLTELAMQTGTFPLLDYNPDRPGSLLSSNLNLLGPVEEDTPWRQAELRYEDHGEPETLDYTLTWADYAFTMKSWQTAFMAMPVDLSRCIPVAAYLALSDKDKETKIPVILRAGVDNTLQSYQVDAQVLRVCAAVQTQWQLLRELSGWAVEYPEHLTEAVRQELEKAYAAEMEQLQQQHAAELARHEEQYLAEVKAKIKAKLMAMSKPPVS